MSRMIPSVNRITRQKLLWSLGFLAATVVPFANDLPLWPVALVLVTIAWRWWMFTASKRMPHGVIRLAWTLCNAAFVFSAFGSFSGLEPGTSLMIVMAAMKLTESAFVRDLIVIVYMSFFLILANFLFDQSMISALYSGALVWLGVTALSQINRGSPADAPVRAFKDSGVLLLQAVPLMLVMFFLFPRVPGPFWSLPTATQATTGLSDNMEPGSISSLLQSSEVAFRVYFKDQTPAQSDLYWRGPVLESVQKRLWSPSTLPLKSIDIRIFDTPLRYQMVLEPHNQHWLLALDLPDLAGLPADAEFGHGGQLLSIKPVDERRSIVMAAHTSYVFGTSLDEPERQLNLDTSQTNNAGARALAKEWQKTASNAQEIVNSALNYFNQQPFSYTLSSPTLPLENATDAFLFDSRRGFCEHYASSFTLLMRYAGVPARVVTGYMGGEFNPMSNHYTIRQSDAHAWAEVWLDKLGWVRVDPTAAVAPERVERGISAALPSTEYLPTFLMSNNRFIRSLRHGLDAIDANWNHWILGYGQQRQLEFLKKIGVQTADAGRLVLYLTLFAIVFMVALTVLLAWLSGTRSPDPVKRVYVRFLRRLNRLGVDTPASEDALTLASRAAAVLPRYQQGIHDFCQLYQSLRYGPPVTADKETLAVHDHALCAMQIRKVRLKKLKQLLGTLPIIKL